MEPSLGNNTRGRSGGGALWLAGLWAISAALLAHHAGPLPAAAVAGLALLVTLRRGRAGGELLALPAMLAALAPAQPEPTALPAGPALLQGTVVQTRASHGGARELTVQRGTAQGRVLAEGGPSILPGDRVTGVVRAGSAAFPDARVPPLVAAAGALRVEAGPQSLPRLVAAGREQLHRGIVQLWPGDRGAFLASLVLGGGLQPPAGLVVAHRATGLSHLLAVSGAHASMLALLLGILPGLGNGTPGRARRRLGAGILLLYGAITGLEPPMLRALCAFAVLDWVTRHGRPVTLAAVLVPPAVLSCLVDPASLLGPSFSLSYAAVAGLWLGASGPRRTALQRWLWTPLRMSFWATAATAPLTLFWFGQMAPCTILATPLLAPVVTLLLAGGLLAPVLAGIAPAAATALAAPVGLLCNAYAASVHAFDLLPGTPVLAHTAPDPRVLAAGVLLGVLVAWRRRDRAGVMALVALACLPHFLPAPRPIQTTLHLFAVGHGQACLVQWRDGTTALIDCGSSTHPGTAARKVATALTRRAIDLLVLTHADADHGNGVADLLQRIPIHTAVLPRELAEGEPGRLLRRHGVRVHALAPGAEFAFADRLTAARPPLAAGNPNDVGLWARLHTDGLQLLLPGDAQQRGIDAALAAGLAGPADALLLPHHGRPDPRAAALLAAVRPRLALASCRTDDGRTAQGELAARGGAEVWTTGENGDLLLRLQPDAVTVHPALPRRIAAR